MSNNKELLQSVLRHYTTDTFDPDRAVKRFRERTGQEVAGRNSQAAWRWALVAVAVVGLAVGLTLHQLSLYHWEKTTASVVELPDGSVVRLRDGAVLAYQPRRFARERTVRLSGTGCFEVKHDPASPFEACSKDAIVRVLGTRFLLDTDAGEVYVLDGRVRFARASAADGLILTKGERAILPESAEVPVLKAPELPNPAAWATGRLAYESVPLGTVLEELSSIYGPQLSVAPETAIGKRLTGDFLLDDGLDFIATAIEAALDVQIARSDEEDE